MLVKNYKNTVLSLLFRVFGIAISFFCFDFHFFKISSRTLAMTPEGVPEVFNHSSASFSLVNSRNGLSGKGRRMLEAKHLLAIGVKKLFLKLFAFTILYMAVVLLSATFTVIFVQNKKILVKNNGF